MKTYIVDSSTAIKWYIPEILSNKAVEFLELSREKKYLLLSPDLIFSEIGNVLWKKCRRGELEANDARKIIAAINEAFPVQIASSYQLLPVAFEIANAFERSVYDSLYLALAKVKEGILVTADERLANAMQNTVLKNAVFFLGDW